MFYTRVGTQRSFFAILQDEEFCHGLSAGIELTGLGTLLQEAGWLGYVYK